MRAPTLQSARTLKSCSHTMQVTDAASVMCNRKGCACQTQVADSAVVIRMAALITHNSPTLHLPTLHLPTLHLPTLLLPAPHLPTPHLPTPHLTTPHLPTLHLPTLHLPTLLLPAPHLPLAGCQAAFGAAAPSAASSDQGRGEVPPTQERAHFEGGDVPLAASILQMDSHQELQGTEQGGATLTWSLGLPL